MQYHMSVLLTCNFTCVLVFIFSKTFRDKKNSGKMYPLLKNRYFPNTFFEISYT
jgi:hypothetical protein